MFFVWKLDNEFELTHDFRVFYNCSLFEVDPAEGFYLVASLSGNTESKYGAKVNGWDYPISSTDSLLWEISEILVAANWDKKANGSFKRQRRPWDKFRRDDLIRGKLISIREAVELYKVKTSEGLTDEEVRQKNIEFLRKQNKKQNGSINQSEN